MSDPNTQPQYGSNPDPYAQPEPQKEQPYPYGQESYANQTPPPPQPEYGQYANRQSSTPGYQSYADQPNGYYPPQSYQPYNGMAPQQIAEGKKLQERSTLFGILGLFFGGLVLGPLAIYYAKKAEALGQSSTLGKVLGWVTVIGVILSILFFILIFVIAIASEPTSTTTYNGV